MLRSASSNISMKRNLSIITNFGCGRDCWYCVWADHPLHGCKDKTQWGTLAQAMLAYRRVSVSGGGDPLYNYPVNHKWWDMFFTVCVGMDINVHTRVQLKRPSFWAKINKCVFSVDKVTDSVIHFLRYLEALTKIRLVHVITYETNMDEIMSLKAHHQLTFKELVGYDDGGLYKKMKEKYPDEYFLDAGDYNTYYMPDNSITNRFLEGK